MSAAPHAGSYLIKGGDASLVAQAVRTLLTDVVGDRDHSLVVEEIGGSPGDEINVGAVVDACMTPPFLVDQRVVILRDAGRLLTADVPRLVDVVSNPLPTTVLIVVGGGGTVPAPLVRAIAAGQVIDTSVSKAGDRKAWLHDHLRGPVKLEPRAAQLLGEHVGEDLGRVEGLLTAVCAAYGEGARISVDDLEPYLGEAGNVPRYELTEAISRGEAPRCGPAPHVRRRRPGSDPGPDHPAPALLQHAGARRRRPHGEGPRPPPSSARRPSWPRRRWSSRGRLGSGSPRRST